MVNSKKLNAWLASAIKTNNKNQRELARVQKKVKKPTCGKGWCGKHSELPTDIDWEKLPRTRFNTDKFDKGYNSAIQNAMLQL